VNQSNLDSLLPKKSDVDREFQVASYKWQIAKRNSFKRPVSLMKVKLQMLIVNWNFIFYKAWVIITLCSLSLYFCVQFLILVVNL
jgi:hypothetical protein